MSEISPFELRVMIASLRVMIASNRDGASLKMVQICDEFEKTLPQSVSGRGKVCSNCQFKMGSRKLRCPDCLITIPIMRRRLPPPTSKLEDGACPGCRRRKDMLDIIQYPANWLFAHMF